MKDRVIEHDISVYEDDPYINENLLSMTNYVKLIEKNSFRDKSFLELGIGHSKTVQILSEKFESLTVIDAERELIEKYQESYPSVNFVNEFFENYEVEKNNFDYIGMGFVLEHVLDPKDILLKYSRALKGNGKLFVSVPNANSLHRLIAYNAGLIDDIKSLSETDIRYGHLRYNSYNEWVDLFKECGWKVIDSNGLYLKPFSTTQISSLGLSDDIYKALCITAISNPEISNSCFFVLELDQ